MAKIKNIAKCKVRYRQSYGEVDPKVSIEVGFHRKDEGHAKRREDNVLRQTRNDLP